MRRPAGRVTRTRSPGRSSRAGFALWSFTSTLPPVQAAAASARLLNRRAAQSHLSARTESAGLAHISAGRRPTPHGPETASAESARANRAPDRYPTLIEGSWRVIARTDQFHSTGSTSRRGRLNVASRRRNQAGHIRRRGGADPGPRVYCPSMTAGRISTGATIRMRGRDGA